MGRIEISTRRQLRFTFIIPLILCFSCSQSPFTSNETKIINYQNSRQISALLNTDLSHLNPVERFRLCLALGNSQDTSLADQIQPFVTDSSALVRSGAAFALGLLPCQASAQVIRQQIHVEKDPETLQQLVLSTGRVGSYFDIVSLTNLPRYNELKPIVFKSAVAFFSRGITPQEIVSECFTALSGPNKIERQVAAIALFRIRKKDLIRSKLDKILSMSENTDPFIRYTVARLLKEEAFPQKNALYRKFVMDHDWRVRYETALAIPFLSNPIDIWQPLIEDNNPYVSATALKHPPAGHLPQYIVQSKVRKMLSSDHPMIRDAAGFFIMSQMDTIYNSIQDSLINNNVLSADIVTALCKRIDNDHSWEYLFDQIKNPVKSISTAAYSGLVNNVDTLADRAVISPDRRNQLITAGLDSDDPVKIFFAANYLKNFRPVNASFVEALYRCLGFNGYQYLDAQLTVLETIAKIQPGNAPKHLSPLLNSRQNRLREAAYRVLVDSYNVDVAPPIPGPDISRYHDLAHVKKYGLNPIIRFETTRGIFDIQCDAFYAPHTVDAFLGCVKQNFYTGIVFHRVVPNFVIQAGDPRGDGWGGPDFHLQTERSPISFETGMVGMASAGPNTEGSQFFITTSPQYHLDTNYTLFGKVIRGMDVVKAIEIGDKILLARIIEPS